MQECGYQGVTPENVGDQDPYEIRAALLYREMDRDPGLKKARDHMAKHRQSNPKPKGLRRLGAGSHLSVVK